MHRPPIEPSFNFTQGTADVRYIRDEQRLKQLARQFVDDYPDVHGMAYVEASKLLLRHTGKHLDPEKVWWHRFSTAMSSPTTYTGWQHSGEPIESMTFVELLLRRFSAHDQQASDDLQLYGGFYTDGPKHGVFDERNEVALLPRQAMADFWALDFSALFQQQINDFWTAHGNTFCTLGRSRFLAAAGTQLRTGSLTLMQFKQLVGAVVGRLRPVMTLNALQTPVRPVPSISLRTFDVGGHECDESFRVVSATGWQVLYLPGDAQVFHVFAQERDFYQWVRVRQRSPETRAAFKALFFRSASAREQYGASFDETLRQMLNTPWRAGQRLLNTSDRLITGDVFEHVREVAKQQMHSDAQTLVTSNTDLRKRIWIGYLNAFLSVFGAIAPLGWPVALTVVGAGIANVALNIDQAVHGKSARERKAGVIGAIFNSIFLAFNLPVLVGLSRAAIARVPGEPPVVPVIEIESATAPHESIAMSELSGLEGNVVLTGQTAGASGHMRGVQTLANGETWISLEDMPYRVVYSDTAQSWTIVHPDAPFSTGSDLRVQLDAGNQWQLQSQSGALLQTAAASSTPGLIRSVRSGFWDLFMQFNLPNEEMQSQIGLARQEAAIDLLEVPAQGRLGRDVAGDEIYVDKWGGEHRVFKTADGRYVGGRIKLYTHDDLAFNRYLRTGIYPGDGQVDLIEDLADDLLAVGHNNNVTLYRGGNGVRGTSGQFFREGRIQVGNVLVNTDISSFSENPYVARVFCSSQAGQHSADFALTGRPITFDDTSVVFELPKKHYLNATPIAPFSMNENEVESIFMPGHYFVISDIKEVAGDNYRFINVRLIEVPRPTVGQQVYDMRTGQPFSREEYATRLGTVGQPLLERFFPLSGAQGD